MSETRTIKESYQLRITLIGQYIMEVSKAYNKPIRDIGEECIYKAIHMKHSSKGQTVLPIEQTLLPLDTSPYALDKLKYRRSE